MEAYQLLLVPGEEPSLIKGIPVVSIEKKDAIAFAVIENAPARKTRAFLDRQSPALVTNGLVYDVFFKKQNGTVFSDEATFVTAACPNKKDGKVLVLTDKRWPHLKGETLSGTPDGFIPGGQILKDADSIGFVWENVKYMIYRIPGEVVLSKRTTNTIAAKATKTPEAMQTALKESGLVTTAG